jgi:hypothetical protein
MHCATNPQVPTTAWLPDETLAPSQTHHSPPAIHNVTELQLSLKDDVDEVLAAAYGHSHAAVPWYHYGERMGVGGESMSVMRRITQN